MKNSVCISDRELVRALIHGFIRKTDIFILTVSGDVQMYIAFFKILFNRRIWGMESKLRLYGFNNLTKSLSFNIYDVCYAKTAREQKDYIAYIDEQYNSERLTKLLTDH